MSIADCQKNIMCWKIRHWNEYNLQPKNYSVQEITLKFFSLKLPNFWLKFLFPLVWWKTASLWRFWGHSRTKSVGAWVSATGLAALSLLLPCHTEDLGVSLEVACGCVYPFPPPSEVCCQDISTTKNRSDLLVPLSPHYLCWDSVQNLHPGEKERGENKLLPRNVIHSSHLPNL